MELQRSSDGREIISEETLRKIVDLIGTVQYGTVTLLIRDGEITQIEKNEKIRLK